MTKQEFKMLHAAVKVMDVLNINDKYYISQNNVLFMLQETYRSSTEKEVECEHDYSICLTSMPPQYKCFKCGKNADD